MTNVFVSDIILSRTNRIVFVGSVNIVPQKFLNCKCFFFGTSKGDEDMGGKNYKSYDELPLMLDAKMIKDILGVSIGLVYELMKSNAFPSIKIGSRYIVPKEKFIEWIEKQSGT